MKSKALLLLFLVFSIVGNAQQKNILKVNDIQRIENYLLKTKSKDQYLLKKLRKKLATLKQNRSIEQARALLKEQTKKRAELVQKKLKLKIKAEKNIIVPVDIDKEEFDRLTKLKTKEHTNKTVALLNAFFDNDPSSVDTILLIENLSDCNMVLNLKGENSYKMAIPKHQQEIITLKKGNYELSGRLCNKKYLAKKMLHKNFKISLR